jgi:pimeloyl-ACP methyl ester carboxylesterase
MLTPETIEREVAFLDNMATRMLTHATPMFVFRRQMEAIGRFDTHDRLGKIAAPTLVITGNRDVLVPPRNSEVRGL